MIFEHGLLEILHPTLHPILRVLLHEGLRDREPQRGHPAHCREAPEERIPRAWSVPDQRGEREEDREVAEEVAREAREREVARRREQHERDRRQRVEPEREPELPPRDPRQPERGEQQREVDRVPGREVVALLQGQAQGDPYQRPIREMPALDRPYAPRVYAGSKLPPDRVALARSGACSWGCAPSP